MTVSLRTRLFVTIAVVLAVSIAASSLLSRRATLVEVREIVARPAVQVAALDSVKARIERALVAGTDLNAALAEAARESDRRFIVIDPDKRVVGASSPVLASAHVKQAGGDGDLALEIQDHGTQALIAVRGAPPVPLTLAGGGMAALYSLPRADTDAPPGLQLLPPWVLATAAVALVALVLTFTLSRRILRPVEALTVAARRMQQGELDVQVAAGGRDEIGELGRAFNAMASELAETERQRRQMVSDVAHELRSPVTNLRCSLEAMQDGLVPLTREGVDELHEETVFLQRLIDDLQDLALAEAGRLALHVGPVEIASAVRRVAAAMMKSPGAPIDVVITPGLPPVAGDEDRIEQVLRNLLTNARRHTPADGRIAVNVSFTAPMVRITVRDTGSGIAAEHLPHIFDRFYRADGSRARATGGAGLGLAIARQLVSAHGGTIAAASEGEGRGVVVTVDLPASPPIEELPGNSGV